MLRNRTTRSGHLKDPLFSFALCLLLAGSVPISEAQQAPAPTVDQNQPQVRVNYLNVCTPSDDEQKQIRTALSSLPATRFAPDFEISRGHSSMQDAPAANWVRIRREFPANALFVAAQYSISVDEHAIIETLVFKSREAKDIMQVQLEQTVTGTHDAKTVLQSDTPVNRIRLERLGKSSVVLTRCSNIDQAKYEPLFRQASQLLANYRAAMDVKRLAPRELAMLNPITASSPRAAKKK